MRTTQSQEEMNRSALDPEVRGFLNSLRVFQCLASRHHFRVKTHSEQSLAHFQTLSHAAQKNIIRGFTGYLDFLTRCSFAGLDLRDDLMILKTFFKTFEFIHDDEIFDRIRPGDVIEIYTEDQIQIFRNLVFLDLCSYTLLDLLSYDPYELYERSEKIKIYLNDSVQALAQRPYSTSAMNMDHVPQHILREKFSDQRLTSLVRFKFISPLFKWPSRSMAGFVAVQEGRNMHDAPAEGVLFL